MLLLLLLLLLLLMLQLSCQYPFFQEGLSSLLKALCRHSKNVEITFFLTSPLVTVSLPCWTAQHRMFSSTRELSFI